MTKNKKIVYRYPYSKDYVTAQEINKPSKKYPRNGGHICLEKVVHVKEGRKIVKQEYSLGYIRAWDELKWATDGPSLSAVDCVAVATIMENAEIETAVFSAETKYPSLKIVK